MASELGSRFSSVRLEPFEEVGSGKTKKKKKKKTETKRVKKQKRKKKIKKNNPKAGRGWLWMYSNHVRQANEGCDFDFLESDFGISAKEPDIF